MYPYIHIILPSYTVMALLGGFVALCYIFFRLEKFSVEFSTFLKLFFFCVLGGIVGSKLLFALTQLNWLFHNFSVENMVLLIPQSGFVFYGGLFGVIFTLLFFTRKDRDLRNLQCLYFMHLEELDASLRGVVTEKHLKRV